MSIPLIIGVLAVYFLGMIGIGWYGRKYAQTFESFTNAGRSCGAIMLIGTCVGSQIGNGFVVGGAGDGSVFGLSGAQTAQRYSSIVNFQIHESLPLRS